ncbi:MAG TPA: efflux RND transporter periplasmic adaptor subunit [Acetobacteraceae bacterium]|nr:efflux RND transporter periplasmic adaptor subunit [Acetobacteraceae bacterium]
MNHLPADLPETVGRETEQQSPPGLQRGRRRMAWLLGLGTVLGLGAAVAFGAWGHARTRAAATATLAAMDAATPVVRIEPIKAVDTPREVELPGSTQAFDSATLFARATGYIGSRAVDIGSRVKAGDVLAVISAPDLDQQLAQARAQLVQMQAQLLQAQTNMELAKVTNNRTTKLVTQGWTSAQQGDTDRLNYQSKLAAVAVAQGNVQAQQAQVGRLEQMTGFERVVAPFDGVITSRQIDVGSLVTADASSGTPLFSIDRISTLRVQVYVPQEYVFGLKDGQDADVTVPELPGRVFHGRLARTASALRPDTRTVLAEVDVDNADGALTAGLYAIVHLKEPRPYPVVVVPSPAVVYDAGGPTAAVYDQGLARLRHLDLAADNGATVEVRSGLRPGDRLILNPPIGVTDGMRVTPAPQSGTRAVAMSGDPG